MPICIPNDLPARKTLNDENIFVMDQDRATSQDIRPLQILLLNLMPTKIATETQFARLLGNTPLQIELELMTVSRKSTHVSEEHMINFYKTFDQIKDNYYDGFVITGAPVEQMEFEEVDYWDELCEIMDWSCHHVYSTLHICWGAQAGLYHHYGVKKVAFDKKLFGVFKHKVVHKGSILFRGFDDIFNVPHSRHTGIDEEALKNVKELKILAASDLAGSYAISTDGGRQIFITGHSEYDPDTLKNEYFRDKNANLPIEIPINYFPDDDDTQEPVVSWRSSANLMFSNWLNYFVYQETPYDISTITTIKEKLDKMP